MVKLAWLTPARVRRLAWVAALVATPATSALPWQYALAAQEVYVPTIEDVARASALVDFWVDDGRIPGAVLSVWRWGTPMFEASYGYAQSHAYGSGQYGKGLEAPGAIAPLNAPVAMSVETVFDLASVTKVMATTAAVALLVNRGELDLQAPVSRYLPDFRGGGREGITVAHLLTHRSGLSQWQPIYYHADSSEAAYRFIRDLPLQWPVGAERHYSDLGFMLLGLIVEKVSGEPLDGFLKRELYGPLGLYVTGFRGSTTPASDGDDSTYASTSHGNPFEHRMVHDSEFGYRIDGDPDSWSGWRRYTLTGEVNDGNSHHAFGGTAGHAGLFSTAGELQKLVQLWLGRGSVDGRRYLDEALVDGFLTSTGDGQALGWQVPTYAPDGAFHHTGFTGTFVLGVPDAGLGVVLLTNRQNGGVDGSTAYPDLAELQRAITQTLTGTR